MAESVVFVSGVRTAVGTFGGSLAAEPPSRLGALCIAEALRRAEIGGDRVGHVVVGSVIPTEPRDAYIARVFAVMALAQRHTFQVLTKRPARMAELLRDGFGTLVDEAARELHAVHGRGADCAWMALGDAAPWPLPNVWLGVSVEDQAAANARIPALLATDAAVRFLSCEPLLGAVDLRALRTTEHGPYWMPGDSLDALSASLNEANRWLRDQHELFGGLVNNDEPPPADMLASKRTTRRASKVSE